MVWVIGAMGLRELTKLELTVHICTPILGIPAGPAN